MEFESIAVDSVQVPDGRRRLRGVEELAASIAELGLLSPIRVTPNHVLISGLHRLEAAKSLGWTEIPSIIDSEPGAESLRWALAEIDENLIRNDLNVLERCNELARRKVIYEKLHPESVSVTVRGGPGRGKTTENISAVSSFATDTATKTGVTDRTVRQEVQIANRIVPEVKEAIRQTPIAESKIELLRLARMKSDGQRAVAVKVQDGVDPKKVLRQVHQEARVNDFAPPPGLPIDKYQVIYADPPWAYDWSVDSGDSIEAHYPTLSLDEIMQLDVPSLAARDCVLFLWTTSPKLKESMQVIDAWGFSYRTCSVWIKDRIGPGYYFRQRHELLLVATRGEPPTPRDGDRPDSVQESPRQEHSRKPERYYELIEAMYPKAARIELFARPNERREGWTYWGNEA